MGIKITLTLKIRRKIPPKILFHLNPGIATYIPALMIESILVEPVIQPETENTILTLLSMNRSFY